MRNVVSHHLLHSPVGPFGLAVCLRMEGGGHSQLDLEEAVELLPERTGKPNVAVRNELKSQPMTTADLVEVKPCGLLGSDDGVGGDEYDGLGQLVDNYEDSVEAAAWGEGHDEVH
jgi:hypothetical protein